MRADHHLEVDGATLAYDDTGEGGPVLYAHGMLLSRAEETRLGFTDWSPLTAVRRLVRYDARGHGRSTGRPRSADYTWSHLAGDLLAMLDRVAPGARADCVGASMGCGVLLTAAVRAPERFGRLVLVIPPTAWETRAALAANYAAGAALVEAEGRDAFVRLLTVSPRPPLFAGAPSYPPVPDVTEELLPSVLRGAADSDLPDPEALRALTQPVLILAWDTDPSHPVSTTERLAELLPNAEAHVSRTLTDVETWGSRAATFLEKP